MTNAEHIMAWAESSRYHYDRLCELETIDPARGGYRATLAYNIVSGAHGEAVRGGDIVKEGYSAEDIIDAAKLALAFKKEG